MASITNIFKHSINNMKLNKLFLLAGIATLGFAMSACSDDDDYTPGAPVSGDCPALSFVAEETGKSVELDPADPTEITFTVTREKGDAAASYKGGKENDLE